MKKNVRYWMAAVMAMVMLCGVCGCSGMNSHEDIGQDVNGVENKQVTEENNSGEIEETISDGDYAGLYEAGGDKMC